MKGFLAFLLVALLALNVFNCWQIQRLQAQVAALQNRASPLSNADRDATSLLDGTLPLLSEAQAAIRRADFRRARTLIGEATTRADQLSRTAGDKASVAAGWLRRQAQGLEDQMRQNSP